jgi:Macrocin-O-methyltransferase (TylF)
MRSMLKRLAAQVDLETYQRLMVYPLLKQSFSGILSAPAFPRREQLWSECIERASGRQARLTYLEFGVHEGYSIRFFANLNTCPESVFIGLDSFEGLPEDWGGSHPRGTFDTQGRIPQIDDPRVRFIKGWFQDTWDALSRQLDGCGHLVVHYDADLYSSTLFALSKIDTLQRDYLAVFDEFTGDEARALHNYLQSYNASVTFLGQVQGKYRYPQQVMCRIVPRKHHEENVQS